MTRKDYIVLAAAIAAAYKRVEPFTEQANLAAVGVEIAAQELANTLARDNPRFDHARFAAACGQKG